MYYFTLIGVKVGPLLPGGMSHMSSFDRTMVSPAYQMKWL